jgi:hypothetical protein
MKTANILLRHPIDEGETAWRAYHNEMLLGHTRRENPTIQAVNPRVSRMDYTIPTRTPGGMMEGEVGPITDEESRASWLDLLGDRLADTEGALWDVPIHMDDSDINKWASLTLLSEARCLFPDKHLWVNLGHPDHAASPGPWQDWTQRAERLSGHLFYEYWMMFRVDRDIPDRYITEAASCTKPAIFGVQNHTLPPEQGMKLGAALGHILSESSRWFDYRQGTTWREPGRIETWQHNDLMRVDLGYPLEPLVREETGIYRRRFSGGMAIANISNGDLVCQLDGAYRERGPQNTLGPSVREVMLEPKSGAILVII